MTLVIRPIVIVRIFLFIIIIIPVDFCSKCTEITTEDSNIKFHRKLPQVLKLCVVKNLDLQVIKVKVNKVKGQIHKKLLSSPILNRTERNLNHSKDNSISGKKVSCTYHLGLIKKSLRVIFPNRGLKMTKMQISDFKKLQRPKYFMYTFETLGTLFSSTS